MVEWYTLVLEAEVAFANSKLAFLCYDEQNHRIALIERPGTVPRPDGSAGLDHLAFAYADEAELGTTYRRLHQQGIVPARAVDHGSSLSLYYQDPDGNQVELKVDSLDGPVAQHAWLRSPEFAESPLGQPFDPAAKFAEV